MRKIFLGFVLLFLISSFSTISSAKGLFDNRFFPSQEAKDHCRSLAWTDNSSPPISIVKHVDRRTDKMRQMEYDKCIEDWYKY